MRKYNESLFLGSLAAGGTLGILIPPSISLILIGLLTNTSVPELYLAGIIPGVLLSLLFIAVIAVFCVARPSLGGEPVKTSWSMRFRSLPDLLAPAILFVCVVGSIYGGIATPTEAASIGVVVALIVAASSGSLTLGMLLAAFEGTMRTTGMIMLITFAAIFLNFVLGFVGLTTAIVDTINALGLTPVQTVLCLVVFYLVIGMFMETLSMLLTTVPIVFPIVSALGVPEFSDVWFGILMILLMETALITPPIGMNLYVVQSIRSRGGRFKDVASGSLPFVLIMLIMIGLLIAFPVIATWLPDRIYR
jgi:C4-dicarboxylate transporter DctM subunit